MTPAQLEQTARRPSPSLPVIMLLIGVSPLATDMHLAAMPAMSISLHASASTVQLTLTTYLLGLALGQLLIGPISDGIGRRPFLIAGSGGFLTLSVVCAIAPNGAVLVLARTVQGFVSGVAIACGRAVIADHSSGARADRRFGAVTAAGLVGPVIAPVIGGIVLTFGTWRQIFWTLALLGALMLAGVLLRVPETLPPEGRHPQGVVASARRMMQIAQSAEFRGHVITSCLMMAGFFCYIGGSSFALQRTYRISESAYTAVFATNATAMVAASVMFTVLVARYGARRLRLIGLSLALSSAAGLLTIGVTGQDTLITTWMLLCAITAGMGLVLPASIALGQRAGSAYPGAASALQGAAQFLSGSLAIPLVGALGYTTIVPMAGLITGFFVLAAISLLTIARDA